MWPRKVQVQNQIKQAPCHIPEEKLAETGKGTGGIKVGANGQFRTDLERDGT